uniref:Uncharacterized protein n=1 Tax=Avena sativa TaxID=4498 RepID=A0ACD5YY70_AVESA
MAWALLAAGAAAAAALQSPRRSAAVSKGHPNEAACMGQHHRLHWKQPLLAAESHRSGSLVGCSTGSGSGSSAEAAISSRSTYVSSSNDDVSMRDSVDAVLGGSIVISGYWSGPDTDDGCGHIQAVLQRVS